MSIDGTSQPPRVALVGLGNMGLALAARLLEAGLPLQLGNRTPGRAQSLIEGGAGLLDAPGQALERNDFCLTSLADDDAVETLVLGSEGILGHARPGTTLVEMSTISVAASRRVAELAEERGVEYVRAPISGNPVAVASGKAAIFVSGPTAAIDRCEPVLAAITTTIRRVGDGESARVLKLVLAVLVGGTAELLAESLVLGESAGLDRGTLLEAIGASVVGSTFIGYKSEPLLRGDYSATFTTSMLLKDIDLVLDLAEETGAELPVASELRSLLDSACEAGHADEDFMVLLLQLEQRAGLAGPDRRGVIRS
jgi:3-hydroxyisobutyrate dehydrogenase-like beta-hydroxyacid dehydrogenase